MSTGTMGRQAVVLVLLSSSLSSPRPGAGQPVQARPALDLEQWTAKIHAGWLGKVAAGSGALPTEMWPKERIREKYGALTGPPQKPTSRGPLDDTTLALLGWQAAHEHGPEFTTAQIAQQWVERLKETDLQGGGFGKEFLDALARLGRGELPAAIAIARRQLPAEAVLARLIDDVIRWHQEEANDGEKTWQRFVDTYRDRSPAPARSVPVVAPEIPVAVDPPEGFGATSKGGEGGRVMVVTTLADGGPGSLREALAAEGPRIIRFAVEGTIQLESRLRCTNGRVTIDAGSAPGQGITLLNHGIQFRGDCDDIIVRNLRIRVLTGGAEGDCLLFWGHQGGTVERVLVDHCSLMWATDEVVNTWGNVRDLTCQWTIIAEAQLPHSKGWLSGVGSDRISIHHCLFAHNADRVPKLEGGVYDVVNNVLYNWGHNNAAKVQSGARVNLINNWFLPGPDSSPQSGCVFPADLDKGTKVYLSGNIGPYTSTGGGDQWANVTCYEQAGGRWVEHRPAPAGFRAAKPLAAAAVTAQSAQQASELVLARAGAKVRDADDLRVIRDVQERAGRVGRKRAAISAPAQPARASSR